MKKMSMFLTLSLALTASASVLANTPVLAPAAGAKGGGIITTTTPNVTAPTTVAPGTNTSTAVRGTTGSIIIPAQTPDALARGTKSMDVAPRPGEDFVPTFLMDNGKPAMASDKGHQAADTGLWADKGEWAKNAFLTDSDKGHLARFEGMAKVDPVEAQKILGNVRANLEAVMKADADADTVVARDAFYVEVKRVVDLVDSESVSAADAVRVLAAASQGGVVLPAEADAFAAAAGKPSTAAMNEIRMMSETYGQYSEARLLGTRLTDAQKGVFYSNVATALRYYRNNLPLLMGLSEVAIANDLMPRPWVDKLTEENCRL